MINVIGVAGGSQKECWYVPAAKLPPIAMNDVRVPQGEFTNRPVGKKQSLESIAIFKV